MSTYDRIGRTYSTTRSADPRIAAQIARSLTGMASVVDVGSGTGSYETVSTVLGVEPSAVMVAQRPAAAAPCVRGVAEALPMADRSVDAALAVFTTHHWNDLEAGVAELRRVARHRVVVLTWDPAVFENFWLIREYLPGPETNSSAASHALAAVLRLLPDPRVEVVPVPHDCTDGFAAAFWRRPHAYLDPRIRQGASRFADARPGSLDTGLHHLATDLESGQWHRNHVNLLGHTELDTGYRLVTADL